MNSGRADMISTLEAWLRTERGINIVWGVFFGTVLAVGIAFTALHLWAVIDEGVRAWPR